jgi:2-dehydro-3-deoxyphosphooctonate aldolase (KDO 8-P synthase)
MPSSDELYARLRQGRFIIAGPCVLEDFSMALDVARAVREAADAAGLFAVFKSSYDKANRSSLDSFRGPGPAEGLKWLARIREETGLPCITDIHAPEEAREAAQAVDILQIPAFLCRQTDLLLAASASGKPVNIKKGQFLAPWDMKGPVDKARSTGNGKVLVTERGSSFGYNNLVVDMRSVDVLRSLDLPVVMDATHAVQLPGAAGKSSGGERRYVPLIARAAVAAGADGVFLETHPDPDHALCDGPNSWPLEKLPGLLQELAALWKAPHAAY